MANPPSRRTSSSSSPYSTSYYILPISENNQFQLQTPQITNVNRLLNSTKFFLKKPHAFPFLLSIFFLLTWVSLRLQHLQHPRVNFKILEMPLSEAVKDQDANLVRFSAASSTFAKDEKGWLVDPVSVALEAGIQGGATICTSVHVGEIKPGSMRGNHRHHFCNETFIIWGAKTLFRVENSLVDKGFGEVIVGADEVAVAASPHGTAHVLVNLDSSRTTFFMGCQDNVVNYNDSSSDFNVWNDVRN